MKPLAKSDLEHILLHTSPLWERARGRRIFLTGCTGFFGAWLLESLVYCNRELDLGLSATVLSRAPDAYAVRMPHIAVAPCIRMHQGEARSFEYPDGSFDFVVHGAASSSAAAAQQPDELLSTIVDGTECVLAFSRARGVSDFLLVSSGAVYGKQPATMSHIPEEFEGTALEPNAAYAEGKRAAERMCTTFANETKIRFSIARCFAFVGPHLPMDAHFAIGNFIRDAMAGNAIIVRGDGTAMRSYLYAADLAIWLWTLLLAERPSPQDPVAVNVGSSEAISILDLARAVADELCPGREIEIAQQAVEGAPVLRYVPDVARATSMGLRQYAGLREGIRRTAEWHR